MSSQEHIHGRAEALRLKQHTQQLQWPWERSEGGDCPPVPINQKGLQRCRQTCVEVLMVLMGLYWYLGGEAGHAR
jgi:hypothetical protein